MQVSSDLSALHPRRSRSVAVLAAVVLVTAVTVATPGAGASENTRICNSKPGASIPASFMLDVCFDGSNIVLENHSSMPLRANTTPYVAAPRRESFAVNYSLSSQILLQVKYLFLGGDPYLMAPGTRLTIPIGTRGNTVNIQRSPTDEIVYLLAQGVSNFLPGVSHADMLVDFVNALLSEWQKWTDCMNRNNFIGDAGCLAQLAGEVLLSLAKHGIELGLGAVLSVIKTVAEIGARVGDVQRFNESEHTITVAAVHPPATHPPATHPPATHPPVTNPPVTNPPRQRVNAYDNYGSGAKGRAMCRGNPGDPRSMPGGVASQSFDVPGGVASIDAVKVQIDPDSRVTARATLAVNGVTRSTDAAAANGDTVFGFASVSVRPGDSVGLTISFTATYGKIVTVYTVGNPGGRFTAANGCPDGAPDVDTTSTGLRAVFTGWSR